MTKMNSLKKIAAAAALVAVMSGCAFAAPAPRPMQAPHGAPVIQRPAPHIAPAPRPGVPMVHPDNGHRAPAPKR